MIEQYIRDVPDFPKEGILFKDITPLLGDPKGLRTSIEALADVVDPDSYDQVVGIESRGFIFGTALALHLDKGFVPIRKPGKLPWKTASESYELEYGSDTIEIHVDAFEPGPRTLIVDDLLATGRDCRGCPQVGAACRGEPVACAFVIELSFLPGREKLDVPVHALMKV